MKQLHGILLITILPLLVFGLAACSMTGKTAKPKMDPTIKTILVLPVEIPPDQGKGAPPNSDLVTGIKTMNQALAAYFADQDNVRLLPTLDQKINGLEGSNRLNLIRNIGTSTNSDAVLACTMGRYIERQGKKYGAEAPASVSFDCKLIEVSSGRALCFFTFDETQQALSENILTLPGAARRGFKWLTAEELLLDGLETKLANCIYLKKD